MTAARYALLTDGSTVLIRPARPADAGAVQAMHAGGCPQEPRHDMEGNVGGVRFAERSEHLDTVGGGQRGGLTHQATLANTR